ncbi:hypothetical protein AQUCO_09600017v1 [Aquilegia coerulea]|uniref:Pentacotripeptide-repeat region of PRORP domain-containing protein n=1 Tax=Aquilegia coerulea TaxID=218851 RepID=A0A2G5C4G5_AQUCA|nr:hypothetical protein AQUCO_09600017v1 [Aquilegia coerulea]
MLVKHDYKNEDCVVNSLLDMYLKNRKLSEALKTFEEMSHKDVISWNVMASGCLQCGEPKEALGILEEMKKVGVKPNKFTLATSLTACATLTSLKEGKKAHTLRLKLGDEVDICVDNALLDMYAKCGCINGAWGVFRSMKDRSVVSWTTMIMGFAHNGQPREALKIFNNMRSERVHEGGFIEEGWEYFSSMTSDHGISPGEDHYACMVNLLGRAGKIKEAEDLIRSMPFRPGPLVHGDLEVGKRAAEHTLALDKEDPSTYVLLSNILADSSNWDSVGKLRELMDTTHVKKLPGSSWIDLAGNG